MGKYMKKSKTFGDVAVIMDHSSLGVRTRARAHMLPQIPDHSYLQLRSRRLLKPPPTSCSREAANSNSTLNQCSTKTASSPVSGEKLEAFAAVNVDVGMEASFGENFLEIDSRDRSSRESTPCSSTRDSNAIHTPGSTTSLKRHQLINEHIQRNIPTAYEMEEFFAYAEKQQQTIFMEKYNFDIVNDVPLPGRYEWVPVLN